MLDGAHRTKRYVIFSATSRSPTSYVGYMDSEGMKRGSATNLHRTALSRRAGSHNSWHRISELYCVKLEQVP